MYGKFCNGGLISHYYPLEIFLLIDWKISQSGMTKLHGGQSKYRVRLQRKATSCGNLQKMLLLYKPDTFLFTEVISWGKKKGICSCNWKRTV